TATLTAVDLTELACQLVAIDAVNPDLVPGAAGEREIAAFVQGWAPGGRSGGRASGGQARPPERARTGAGVRRRADVAAVWSPRHRRQLRRRGGGGRDGGRRAGYCHARRCRRGG